MTQPNRNDLHQPIKSGSAPGARRRAIVGALTLAIAVCLAHAWCLDDGTVLDDWQHQEHLRERGWSLEELMASLVIRPADWVTHWWQTREVRWEYARPAFILSMKTLYHVLGRDDPLLLHAYSLFLHFLCAVMVWRIALLLTGRAGWSLFAGLMSSSQNCVQQTALTLAALLCYLRATRLNISIASAEVSVAPGLRPGRFAQLAPPAQTSGAEPGRYFGIRTTPALRALIGCFALWIAALLTKENALLLPPIVVAFDLAFGGWRTIRRRLPIYAAFGLIGGAFLAWRSASLQFGMPDVYIRRPQGDWTEYLAWCAAKVLHYVTTSIWPAPMTVGPTGRFNPWREVPQDCLLMLAITGGLSVAYWLCTRRQRAWWIWPLWILLSVLPVTPVIATAHSGYLSGVGYAIGMSLCAAGGFPGPSGASRVLNRIAGIVAIVSLFVMSLLTMLNRWQWTGIIAAERFVPAFVQSDPPADETEDVFFINVPFVNVYAKPQLDRLDPTRYPHMRAHVLTYASQPVLSEQRVTIEQLSPFRFSARVEGQAWFSRLMGRFLIEGFREPGRFHQGDRFETRDVTVEIAEADDLGVWKMIYTFPRPLADPRMCFYLSTADCGAAKLHFRGPEPQRGDVALRHFQPEFDIGSEADVRSAIDLLNQGEPQAMNELLSLAKCDNNAVAESANAAIREIAGVIAAATGSSLQEVLLGPHVEPDPLAPPPRIQKPPTPPPLPALTDFDLLCIRTWWNESVTPGLLKAVWSRREEFAAMIHPREEVPHARQWAALLTRADLYLTGPPFPGPRSRKE